MALMRILGIETSCDETAVCLAEASGAFPDRTSDETFRFKVLGNALYSQVALHAQYGGVFPNLAKREHAKNLVPLLEQALTTAEMLQVSPTPTAMEKLLPLKALLEREAELFTALLAFALRYQKPDVDAIAVTHGPGLEPALWVGVNFAKALSVIWDVPLVAVNHMEGHILISTIGNESDKAQVSSIKKFAFPLLSLLISGGHTELVLSTEPFQYEKVGETRDDAAGEAFDKVARLMGLPYPGGPEISRLAAEARAEGLVPDFTLTRPMMKEDSLDFSFSGLKTAVRRIVEASTPLTDEKKKMISLEFENTVADVLVGKTMLALEKYGARSVLVGGGVSANTEIRARLAAAITEYCGNSVELLTPEPSLATDNAIMIALAGYFHAARGDFADPSTLSAHGSLSLNTRS